MKTMDPNALFRDFPGAITVCDLDGIILALNNKALETFAADGGAALLGTNVLDCHPEPSKTGRSAVFSNCRSSSRTRCPISSGRVEGPRSGPERLDLSRAEVGRAGGEGRFKAFDTPRKYPYKG
jgi:hypothetical protein